MRHYAEVTSAASSARSGSSSTSLPDPLPGATASSEELHAAVLAVRSGAPCSVVLPAGAGKTHLIAQVIRALAEEGRHALLLTHTNAGVDAMRRRLREFGVHRSARVRTIAGWALDVVGRVPQLSEMTVGPEPDWALSGDYVRAATLAVGSLAGREVLRASYDMLLVDEYQDCTATQHALILELAETLPVAVFGDPLQGLFGFEDDAPPVWQAIEAAFPAIHLRARPHRWRDDNPALGEWLLTIREPLRSGFAIDLDGAPLRWVDGSDPNARTKACWNQPEGSVVALGRFRNDCAAVAKNLGGAYSVMEEFEGKALMDLAELVDAASGGIAFAVVDFAMKSGSGLPEVISADKRRRLETGKTISTRKSDLEGVHTAVNALHTTAAPGAVAAALRAIGALPSYRLCCREAWYGVLDACDRVTSEPDLTMRSAVVQARNRTRIIGRRPEARVISRPRLVKGLEYDHAVLLDADRYDAAELYVSLTRPRRSLTVVSAGHLLGPFSSAPTAK